MVTATAARPARNGQAPEPSRLVAIVARVSTDRQAASEEGSLKNQLQRLRQHVEYKRNAAGEDWREVEVYELRAISGKDSMRSEEFQRLFADIRSGRINTILCTALDRICRSVKDFLNFFEFLNEHGVEFVCLKQNYDTTTPQGRLFVTIMMALAEFEREQTSDRTREATAARAERGLWNGGRLLGYDLDPDKKGYLVANPEEADLVNFAFDTYLACGSIAATREIMNSHGYRTKTYTSRRDRHHPGKPFTITSVQYLLKNPAYIGKKEINKKAKGRGDAEHGYRLVDAVWPAIVDEAKFHRVSALLAVNGRTKHNGVRPVRHVYVLGGGILHCGRCDAAMEGRSGTGQRGKKYFYYVCPSQDCGLRTAADEIEEVVAHRIRQLGTDDVLVAALVDETKKRLAKELPDFRKRRRVAQAKLETVMSEADAVLSGWAELADKDGRSFVNEKLTGLAQRRQELEASIQEFDEALRQANSAQVASESVREALAHFSDVYGCLKPFERKELARLMLRRVAVGDREIVLEVYPLLAQEMTTPQSQERSEATVWLPGQDSNLQPSG